MGISYFQSQLYNILMGISYFQSQLYNILMGISYFQSQLLGVASKQLRLLHGRVGDSTIVVNSLSPQMRELVEDAIAS